MRTAYAVLGVPANASGEDIEEAFRRVQRHYTPERIAAGGDAVDRFNEARTAYQVLRDPHTRAAHDRKIAAAAAPRPAAAPVAVHRPEASPLVRFLWVGAATVVLLFAVGGYLSVRNAERRAEAAAAEKAAAEVRAREEKERLDAEARAEAQAARQRQIEAARADMSEQRLRSEGRSLSAQQAAHSAREEAAARRNEREALSREQQRAAEERRQQYEAQARVEADKRRVQQLCWQNYGRPC